MVLAFHCIWSCNPDLIDILLEQKWMPINLRLTHIPNGSWKFHPTFHLSSSFSCLQPANPYPSFLSCCSAMPVFAALNKWRWCYLQLLPLLLNSVCVFFSFLRSLVDLWAQTKHLCEFLFCIIAYNHLGESGFPNGKMPSTLRYWGNQEIKCRPVDIFLLCMRGQCLSAFMSLLLLFLCSASVGTHGRCAPQLSRGRVIYVHLPHHCPDLPLCTAKVTQDPNLEREHQWEANKTQYLQECPGGPLLCAHEVPGG